MELLTTLLSTAGRVFIVIDGLDEIDEIERIRLLRCLLELQVSCDEARILISSRMEDDITSVLCDKAVVIRIDNRNAGSIQAFIRRWVQMWLQSRDFQAESRNEIMGLLAPLSSKANGMYSALNLLLASLNDIPALNQAGMFLYAKVVLSCIEHLDDMIAIRNELQVLPDNLDDA